MERVISPEERMKRAEEIYYRRRAQGVRVSTASVNIGNTKKVSLGKKMVVQIIVCILIYCSFWALKNYKSVFSENVINQTKAVLSYDINFQNLYNQSREYFESHFNNIIKTNSNQNSNNEDSRNVDNGGASNGENQAVNDSDESKSGDLNGEETVDNNSQEIVIEEQSTDNSSNNENAGIGGGTDISINSENDGTIKAKIDNENKTQMELDADYIKQNCNLIKPIEGPITSGFGEREQTEIISAFHQGIDIGAPTGTVIHAAMEGTVVAASFAGDYGNHIKIQNGEVLNVYAHCSEINVKVGDYISQGQEIGKVGATGKVTGPHLHFEFRRDGRYVNPEMVMSF